MNNKKENSYPRFQKGDQKIRAKKHLGQHFLKDETIAQKIADTLTFLVIGTF